MRVSFFSAAAVTRFSSPFIRRREGRHSGGSLLSSQARKGRWVVWMGQKLQQQQQHATCSAVPPKVIQNSESRYHDPFVDGREDGVNPRRSSLVVVSFYKFADLSDYAEMRTPLRELCDAQVRCLPFFSSYPRGVFVKATPVCSRRVSGGIILAPEGINGSVCGTREAVENVLTTLQADRRLNDLHRNEAPATEAEEDLHHGQTQKSPLGAGDDAPFRWGHVRVKLKTELVPLGVPGVKPSEKVGKYIKPNDWNALISDPKTVVIDVRNDYEIRIGKFKGAVDPKTEAFREFPAWAENRFGLSTDRNFQDGEDSKSDAAGHTGQPTSKAGDKPSCVTSLAQRPRIAMYCTGGIRCEKATSYLMEKGFNEVYHLEGGILKYLEQVSPVESLWEGECFVFDKRVSVEHGLKQGTHSLCYACKKPVNDDDKKSPLWEEGISCPYCFSLKSQEEKARARARQMQFRTTGMIGGPGNGRRQHAQDQIQLGA